MRFLSKLCALMMALYVLTTPALRLPGGRVAAQGPLGIVSAASFGPAVAPNTIAAAFGQGLAVGLEVANTNPLPTRLGSTQVRVNGRAVGLFFVAPGQINLLVPGDVPVGLANVDVLVNDNVVARGTMQVRQVAPAVFTANANGVGAPVAVLLRRDAQNRDTFETVAQFDPSAGAFVPKPIDLGPEGEQVFLILYGSGLRAAVNSVRVFIGGRPLAAEDLLFVAPSTFLGVDEVGLRLRRDLRGRVELVVDAANSPPSNETEIEIVPAAGANPPRVLGFSTPRVVAGERFEINGSGFAAGAVVHVGGVRATVIETAANRLLVETPFGVRAGKVSVQTAQGEAAAGTEMAVRPSISGYVTDTARVPLRGVRIRAELRGQTITERTGDNGSFVLRDLPLTSANPTANADIYIETSGLPLPYPPVTLRKRVQLNQDNQIALPIALQIAGGASANLTPAPGNSARATPTGRREFTLQTPLPLEADGFRLEFPAGVTVTLPAGATGPINLTPVDGVREQNSVRESRLPARMPPGVFSSRAVQITPFGTRINPGAKLTLPNADNLSPGTIVKFYRLDQTVGSDTLGQFVETATANVSSDGRRIETAAEAIKELSYYFAAAAPQATTVVVGRVVEETGTSQPARPVQQAIVAARGQAEFTDGSGGFGPRNVPVKSGDGVQVSAAYQRSNGRIEYADKLVPANADGLTNAEVLPLPPANRNQAPILLTPMSVTLAAGEVRDIRFTAYDNDPGQRVTINRSLRPDNTESNQNPTFSTLTLNPSGGEHVIRLQPKAEDVGQYTLEISVVDDNTPDPARVSRFVTILVTGLPGSFTLVPAQVSCDTGAPSGPAVRLTWTPSQRASSYEVLRNEMLIARGVTETAYTDKDGLTPGLRYSYRVTARNAVGSRDTDPIAVDIPRNLCAATPVTVSFGTPVGPGTTGSTLTIPVVIGDLTERGVIAYEFDLTFNAEVLQFLEFDQTATMSASLTIAHNPNQPGRLRVAAFGPTPLTGPGRLLLQLRFRVNGGRGAVSPLVWQRFLLNEGDPPLRQTNGSFTVN